VYDITRKDSFENVKRWLNELRENADPSIVLMLVGNKNDLNQFRQVSFEEGQQFAQTYKLAFIETSAKNAINVETSFRSLLEEIYELFKKQNPEIKQTTQHGDDHEETLQGGNAAQSKKALRLSKQEETKEEEVAALGQCCK
jgi:Ras-related protein Rab-11A